jgi:prefoldin subunit 5
MSDADLVALKKAAPLIKEMLVAVDKELYARAEVRAVEGVKLRMPHGNTILVFISGDILGCTIDNSI